MVQRQLETPAAQLLEEMRYTRVLMCIVLRQRFAPKAESISKIWPGDSGTTLATLIWVLAANTFAPKLNRD